MLNVEMNGGTTRVPYVVDATEVVVEVKIEDEGDSGGKAKAV